MNHIDAHVHVWSDDDERYPLAAPPAPGLRPVAKFGPDDMLAAGRPLGVTRFVLVQSSFYGFDHRCLTDVIAAAPGVFRGIAVIDPHGGHVADSMRQLAAQGVTGFRIEGLRGDLSRWLDAPGFDQVFRAASDEALAVCPLIDPEALPALSRMCARYPRARVVIDHFARIGIGGVIRPADADALCAMADHPGVCVKVSAFYGLGRATPPYDDMLPLVRRVFERFGPDRMMWASDGPYQHLLGDYAAAFCLIRDRADFLSETDKAAILGGTAERVFFNRR